MVATTIRFREGDLELFRTIPELYRTLGKTCREYVTDFLNHNGFNESALEDRKRDLRRNRREIDKELYTIDKKQMENMKAKFKEEEELIEQGKMELVIRKKFTQMAKQNYIRYKNDEEMSTDAKLEPKASWIKGRMKDFKSIPGFDMAPNKILNTILEVTEQYREQWDEELGQHQRKYFS